MHFLADRVDIPRGGISARGVAVDDADAVISSALASFSDIVML